MKPSKLAPLCGVLLLAVVSCGCSKLKARDHLNKGVAAYKNAQFQAAIEHFKEAVADDPSLLMAKLYLATALKQLYIPEGDSPENIKIGKQGDAFLRDVADVGEICGGPETVAGDGLQTVLHGYPLKARSEQLYRGIGRVWNPVQDHACAGRIPVDIAERVVEHSLNSGCGGIISVQRNRFRVVEGQRPQVVHSENVVRVAVRIQHGIDTHESFADGLRVKVRARIDH